MTEDCMYERLSETVDWGSAPDWATEAGYLPNWVEDELFYTNGKKYCYSDGEGIFDFDEEGTCSSFEYKNNFKLVSVRHVKKAPPEVESKIQQVVDKHFSPKSTDLLNEVKLIQEERGNEYEQRGTERSFAKIATIYNTLRGADLKPSDVALILAILKDVRFYSQDGLHRDSVIDKISYSALWGELILEERGE